MNVSNGNGKPRTECARASDRARVCGFVLSIGHFGRCWWSPSPAPVKMSRCIKYISLVGRSVVHSDSMHRDLFAKRVYAHYFNSIKNRHQDSGFLSMCNKHLRRFSTHFLRSATSIWILCRVFSLLSLATNMIFNQIDLMIVLTMHIKNEERKKNNTNNRSILEYIGFFVLFSDHTV